MPLDAVNYRDNAGRYEAGNAKQSSTNVIQHALNEIAASQSSKLPTALRPLSLFFGMLILTNLRAVNASPPRPVPASPPDDPPPASAVSSFALPQAIANASSSLLSPGSALSAQGRYHTGKSRGRTLQHIRPAALRRQKRDLVIPLAQQGSAGKMLELLKDDEKTQMLIANNPTGKIMLLGLVAKILNKKGGIHTSRLDAMVNQWYESATQTPIVLAMTEVMHADEFDADSSTLSSLIDQEESEYCALTSGIVNAQGQHQGDIILTKVRGFDDRFGLFVGDTSDNEAISPSGEYLINVMALGLDISLARAIAHFFADLSRSEYCVNLPTSGNVAEFSGKFDVAGLPPDRPHDPTLAKPQELQHLRPEHGRFSVLSRHNETQILRSLLLTACDNRSPTKGKYYLLPIGDGDYQAQPFYNPESGICEQGFPVNYDKNAHVWHRTQGDVNETLTVSIEQGGRYISLYGDIYPLHQDPDGQSAIITHPLNGGEKRIPVYQNPLSNTWHLDVINGQPVFSGEQKNLLRQWAIPPSSRYAYHAVANRIPQRYGQGIVFDVKHYGDRRKAPPRYQVVEIGGMLLPVRMGVMHGHDVGYSIFDLTQPSQSGPRLAWYGGIWRLDPWTSPHVSSALGQQITPDMFATDIPIEQLSAPDRCGITRANNRSYLKLRGQYVEIEKKDIYRVGPPGGKQLAVYYKNHQFFPSRHSTDAHAQPTWLAEQLYNRLKAQAVGHFYTNIQYSDIQQATTSIAASALTPKSSPQVIPVPAMSLNHKRFLVTLGHDALFIETHQDGRGIKILTGNDHDVALDKYHRGLADSDYPAAITVKHDSIPRMEEVATRAQRDAIVRQRMASGTALIKQVLDQAAAEYPGEKIIIVGHADFFQTSVLENDVFSTPQNVYQALNDTLLPLSKAHPNAIIIPGSLYLSQDIPGDLLHSQLHYQQGGISREVQNAVSCSAIVAPVLHQGKLVTLARKGEYLRYHVQDEAERVTLRDLDARIPAGSTLNIFNTKTAPYLDEWLTARSGTLFAGKTLLPNERACVNRYFAANAHDKIDDLFSNEFMIEGTKFLLVVEDEFVRHDNSQPTVRSLAFPQQENSQDANCYDWIIHPAAGDPLDATLRTAGLNYLYADFNQDSALMSNSTPRITIRSVSPDKGLSLFKFISE